MILMCYNNIRKRENNTPKEKRKEEKTMYRIIVVMNNKEMNFGEYTNEKTARTLAEKWEGIEGAIVKVEKL